MKKLYIISLLTILALPAFANDATNPFTNAKTVDEAWNIFETKSQDILDAYEEKLHKKEFKKLKDLREELLGKKPKTDNKAETKKETELKKSELTDAEKEEKLNELRDNAEAMKEKEQSTANKLLGAAGIGATGIGGMQLASGLAEQQADNDAENAMKAYLSTFTCKYGNNHVNGGDTDVELPGGNELVSLYSEYVALANDLKVRKQALDIKPGIESEAILDSATSGLYDDVGTGKMSGIYTSLARALQNPDGEDAKMWAEQKQASADKVKTGAITAGVGAVGSLIGNLAINAKAPKERSAEIKRKYSNLQYKFKEIEKELQQQKGPTVPDCSKIPNSYLDANQGKCIKCASNQEVKENKCVVKNCTNLTGHVKEDTCACKDTAKETNKVCICQLTGAYNADTCECDANATQTGNKCTCNGEFTEENGICKPTVAVNSEEIATVNIPADTTFEFGKSDISDQNKEKLITKIWTELESEAAEQKTTIDNILQETCIVIVGHTDYIGSVEYNKTLSEQRAKSIQDILIAKSNNKLTTDNIKTYGQGPTKCDKNKYKTKAQRAQCRTIDVAIMTGSCSATPTDENLLEKIGTAIESTKGTNQ